MSISDDKDKRISELERELESANRLVNAVTSQLDNLQEMYRKRIDATFIIGIGLTLKNAGRRKVTISDNDIDFFNPDYIVRTVDENGAILYELKKEVQVNAE